MLQNYIIEKFFPSNIEDNINQLHGLKEIDIYSYQVEKWVKPQDNIKLIHQEQQAQFQKNKFFKQTWIYPDNFYHKVNGPMNKRRTMLRAVNEVLVRKDFLEKYGDKLNKDLRNLKEKDNKFIEILKTPSAANTTIGIENLGICNVVETKYRMTIYYEKLHPRQNIVIAWLLLFIGSLEYQLNPALYTEDSFYSQEKILSFKSYKSP